MRPTGLKRGAGANEYYSGCTTEGGTRGPKAWFAAHAYAALKGGFPRLQIKVSVLIFIVIFVVAFLLVIGIVAEVFHSFLVLRFRAGAEAGLPVLLDGGWKFVHVREEHRDLPHVWWGESLVPSGHAGVTDPCANGVEDVPLGIEIGRAHV